jgi:hypothetical protein
MLSARPKIIALLLVTFLSSGCVNASMLCPDQKSTVTYKGLALNGTTSVSCVQTLGGGDVAQVSGIDLAALAAMVAPMVLMAQPPAPQSTPKPEDNSVHL